MTQCVRIVFLKKLAIDIISQMAIVIITDSQKLVLILLSTAEAASSC